MPVFCVCMTTKLHLKHLLYRLQLLADILIYLSLKIKENTQINFC